MLYQEKHISLRKQKGLNPRFHVIVSKAVSPKSTTRNLIKRRIRESLGDFLKNKKLDHVIFLYTKKGIDKESFANIKNQTRSVLLKAGL
jgi:ribonuclease P protein component